MDKTDELNSSKYDEAYLYPYRDNNEEFRQPEKTNPEIKKKRKRKSFLREIIELLIIIVIMFLVFRFVLMSVKVNGTSMLPNYYDGERGIMLRTTPLNQPNYNSIVVINYLDKNTNVQELIVKRVFAMPGDTFEIKNNEIYVNGTKVDDSHRAKDTQMQDYPLIQLDNDEIFVLGDNRQVSLDSRYIGPIHLKDVKAANGIIFWPLNSFGIMK